MPKEDMARVDKLLASVGGALTLLAILFIIAATVAYVIRTEQID